MQLIIVSPSGAKKDCYEQFSASRELPAFLEKFWSLSKQDQDSLVSCRHGFLAIWSQNMTYMYKYIINIECMAWTHLVWYIKYLFIYIYIYIIFVSIYSVSSVLSHKKTYLSMFQQLSWDGTYNNFGLWCNNLHPPWQGNRIQVSGLLAGGRWQQAQQEGCRRSRPQIWQTGA